LKKLSWFSKSTKEVVEEDYGPLSEAIKRRFVAMAEEARTRAETASTIQRGRFLKTSNGWRFVIPGHDYRIYMTDGSYASYKAELDYAGNRIVFTPNTSSSSSYYGPRPLPGLLEESTISDIEFDV
jgi:hypothetical protein